LCLTIVHAMLLCKCMCLYVCNVRIIGDRENCEATAILVTSTAGGQKCVRGSCAGNWMLYGLL